MEPRKLLTLFFISLMLLFTACSNNQNKIMSNKITLEQEIKIEAMQAIKTVGGAFKTTLNKKVKEGGLTNAATFCSTNATHLANKISMTLKDGVKVSRITDKPRNLENKATLEQVSVFDEIKRKLANGEKIDMIVKEKSKNHYQVYKPIMIGAKCLNCHGNNDKRNPKAYTIISKKYPNDQAINYQLGDFRGAFLVDIIK